MVGSMCITVAPKAVLSLTKSAIQRSAWTGLVFSGRTVMNNHSCKITLRTSKPFGVIAHAWSCSTFVSGDTFRTTICDCWCAKGTAPELASTNVTSYPVFPCPWNLWILTAKSTILTWTCMQRAFDLYFLFALLLNVSFHFVLFCRINLN